jgi:hypothetical protein
MVPLVVARLEDARRERIWRDGSNSAPDIALAFGNSAGMVLEEGPAVVYDDGSYAGEAMVPYTARGADLRLAFAKDLALGCGRTTVTDTLTTGVRLGRDAVRDTGPEGDVRQRTVEQLVALQDLAAGLDADIRANRDAVDAERRAATEELRAVIGEAG